MNNDNLKINEGLDVSNMNKIELKRKRGDNDDEDPNANLKVSNEEIKKIVSVIVSSNLSVKEKESHYSKEYPDFYENFPYLFKMACEPNFDKKTFEYILNMRSKILSNNMSEFEASKEVGQKFFDKYMKNI